MAICVGSSLLTPESARSSARLRPADLVFVAPPAMVRRARESVFVIPLTSVAYSAAGSVAALKI